LLKEIIPQFSLPETLQSDNGPAFTSKNTQLVAEALGITCCLHIAWRPQSSGKTERANQTLKKTWTKLCQETSKSWLKMLPIALL
jgi:transposase InsO family protein